MNKDEINYIRDEMKENISIRNQLLTFCFTSVITTIGFGLNNFNEIPYYMYLIPVFITFIFSYRITYYKDKYCKLYAYLKYINAEIFKHEEEYKSVLVYDFCGSNSIFSFVINNELLLLSIICMVIYYIRFFDTVEITQNIFLHIINFVFLIILFIAQKNILHKVTSVYEKTTEYYNKLKDNPQ